MNLLLLLALLGWSPAAAQAAEISQYTVEFSTTTAPLILQAIAAREGIDAESFIKTAECESQFRSDAIGDRNTSFGLYQIHLPAHPEISKAQALDPWFASDWAAQQFKAHRESMWTCWRLYKAGALSP